MRKDFPALHQIPEALKPWETVNRWVCFKTEPRKNGTGLTKPPYNPKTGRYGSVTDPKQWGTYAEAVAAVSRFNLDGIGIVLGNGLYGIDLDNAIDEENKQPRKEAAEILQTMATYTELSPSGSGFHIFAMGDFTPQRKKTQLPGNIQHYDIEMYSDGRFLTVTGAAFLKLPVENRDAEAEAIQAKYFPAQKPETEKKTAPAQKTEADPLNDLALLNMARNSKNGSLFSALYDRGDISGYPSQSEADLALVNIITYWANGDYQTIDRIFRRSALFSIMKEEKGRKKWDVIHGSGKTYGQLTIEKALQNFKPYTQEPQVFQAKPDFMPPQEKKPAPALEFYSAADLENEELAPQEYIIQDILPPGLTLLGASPKLGKSYLVLSLAASIALGLPFWDRETKAGTVLYCDLESNKRRAKKRLLEMGFPLPRNLFIAHRAQQLDTGLLEQIKLFLTEYPDTRAVILDTYSRVKGSSHSRSNAYAEDYQILGPLQTFALEKNISVLVVTHLRKQSAYTKDLDDPFEAITGSIGQVGAADTIWMIKGKRSEKVRNFFAISRDFDGDNIDWKIEVKSGGGYTLLGDTAAIEQNNAQMQYNLSPIVEIIRENTRPVWKVTMRELIEAITRKNGYTSFTEITAAKEIRKLEDELLKYDHILHLRPDSNGGKNGRKHIFKKAET